MSKEILELIENVDPSDTAKLDEIDARVWFFINNQDYRPESVNLDFAREIYKSDVNLYIPQEIVAIIPYYTRSRDALKEIRPHGWFINMEPRLLCDRYGYESKDNTGFYAVAVKARGEITREGFYNMDAPLLQTEELAELHAIIQAIAHERKVSE